MHRALHLVPSLVLATVLATRPAFAGDLRDLYFGEALHHAYQGQFFEALERLDAELAQHRRLDEPQLDSLAHSLLPPEFRSQLPP